VRLLGIIEPPRTSRRSLREVITIQSRGAAERTVRVIRMR
jgi:hypothetical protein